MWEKLLFFFPQYSLCQARQYSVLYKETINLRERIQCQISLDHKGYLLKTQLLHNTIRWTVQSCAAKFPEIQELDGNPKEWSLQAKSMGKKNYTHALQWKCGYIVFSSIIPSVRYSVSVLVKVPIMY